MRIAYIYPTIATKGGVERILVDKMNMLAQCVGYEMLLITYNQGDHPVSFPLNPQVRHVDLKVRTHQKYYFKAPRRWWEGFKRRHWLYTRLRRQIKAFSADVLVTTTSDELSLLMRLKGKTPLVVESHGGFEHLIDYPRLTWRHRWDISSRYRLLKHVDAIVALTARDAERWQSDYPRVRTIPNVVHLNPTGTISTGNSRRIIFVGRLAEQKGISELAAIWQQISIKHPGWQLDVYGEGPQSNLLQSLERLCVHTPVDDIFERYVESSILVVTSRWEPFGLVIPEAMSCGLPVVSFEGDGPCSIITDGDDGFLVEKGHIAQFVERVSLLIEDRELRQRMGRQAVQKAQRFSVDLIVSQWKELFESLINSERNVKLV